MGICDGMWICGGLGTRPLIIDKLQRNIRGNTDDGLSQGNSSLCGCGVEGS